MRNVALPVSSNWICEYITADPEYTFGEVTEIVLVSVELAAVNAAFSASFSPEGL